MEKSDIERENKKKLSVTALKCTVTMLNSHMKWDYIFNHKGLTDILIETSALSQEKKHLRRLNHFLNVETVFLEYLAQVLSNIQIYIFLTNFMPLFGPGHLFLSWQCCLFLMIKWSWTGMLILIGYYWNPNIRHDHHFRSHIHAIHFISNFLCNADQIF